MKRARLSISFIACPLLCQFSQGPLTGIFSLHHFQITPVYCHQCDDVEIFLNGNCFSSPDFGLDLKSYLVTHVNK